VTSDFSVLNVALNSHLISRCSTRSPASGAITRSMLLWTFILVLVRLAVSCSGAGLPPGLRARALSVQGMIGVGFILFSIFLLTSNPFARLDPAPL